MDLFQTPPRALLRACTVTELQQLQRVGYTLLPNLSQPLDNTQIEPGRNSEAQRAKKLLMRLSDLVADLQEWRRSAETICANMKMLMLEDQSADIPLTDTPMTDTPPTDTPMTDDTASGSVLQQRQRSIERLIQLARNRFAGFQIPEATLTKLRRLHSSFDSGDDFKTVALRVTKHYGDFSL